MTAIEVTGIQFLAHGGYTFRSGTEAERLGASRKEADLIRAQPGYRRGESMSVRFTEHGARLYTYVSGRWMDASLQDIA